MFLEQHLCGARRRVEAARQCDLRVGVVFPEATEPAVDEQRAQRKMGQFAQRRGRHRLALAPAPTRRFEVEILFVDEVRGPAVEMHEVVLERQERDRRCERGSHSQQVLDVVAHEQFFAVWSLRAHRLAANGRGLCVALREPRPRGEHRRGRRACVLQEAREQCICDRVGLGRRGARLRLRRVPEVALGVEATTFGSAFDATLELESPQRRRQR